MSTGIELRQEIITNPDIYQVFTDPERPDKEFYLPERLDLMVTGRCALRCAGCWGPSHNSIEPEMAPEQWIDIVNFVDANNRSDRYLVSNLASYRARVCITGGEPLMYDGITELAQRLNDQGTPTTLSTTGYDPEGLLPGVLPNIDELGIPIDGADPEVNSLWRKGKLEDGGLGVALGALLLAQDEFPDVRLTLRTVVHADNLESIPAIPELLEASGLDTTKLNWKFYLHNSTTGPRKSGQDLRPSASGLEQLADKIAGFEPTFKSLATLVPAMPQDRLVINHSGESYFVNYIGNGQTKDVACGNILTSPVDVIRLLNDEYADFVRYACSRACNLEFLREAYSR